MRAVIQRVTHAKVVVDGQVISQMQKGLLVYLGVHVDDDVSKVEKMANKIANLRIFEDAEQKMNQSVKEHHGSLMIISQFTLYGDAKKGNRPSFIEAQRPEEANVLYQLLIKTLRQSFEVHGGQFQAHMMIESVNDGPVTIIYEI